MKRWLAAAIGGCVAVVATAATEPAAGSPALGAVRVAAPHYGDVLFHFFQDDYFNGIVRLESFKQQGHLRPHADDAELLLGGMYLSNGQHREAERIFRDMLARPSTPVPVRDQAWFWLGKVLYGRGYYVESERALRSVAGTLTADLEAERRLLLAQGLMEREQFAAAAAELDGWQGPAAWRAYAEFNLGVALARAGQLDAGLRRLDAVGQLQDDREELKALRDKANLALGYALLQAERPMEARAALARVRLTGPQSNKALLGAGWADASEEKFSSALLPWLELQGRNLLDAAVQESLLAVPYAYAKLDQVGQSAQYYALAIDAYGAETARLDESIGSIRAGKLVERLLVEDRDGRAGWFWQLSNLPDAPESRYLYHLLAGHEFQEGLKNFRALDRLHRNLEFWQQNLAAFQDMVDTRSRSFAGQLPAAEQRLAALDVESLDRRRDAYAARLADAERTGDVAALAPTAEQAQWQRILALEADIAAHGDDPALADAREKIRLAKGVLQWQMAEAYKARAWQARRSLKELEAALYELRTRSTQADRARGVTPEQNEAFRARIDALRPRIETLLVRVADAREQQGRWLADRAIDELGAQKQRLAEYTVQARYALATIYDRGAAAAPGGAP